MGGEVHLNDARAGFAGWAIGDPGRAAVELLAGAPVSEVGQADIEVSSAELPGMAVRAASVRGLMHRARGGPRQDALALAKRSQEAAEHDLIAVVCDGVGSLERSHEAANAVARGLALEAAAGKEWPTAFASVNDTVASLAERALGEAGDGADASANGMATTAVAVVLRPDGDGWSGELAWVGDSSCWHLDASGSWTPLGGVAEETEAYHTGRVRPLPSEDGQCETSSFRVDGGAVFLLTDGVANPLAWSEQVQATLAEWWSAPPDVLTFAGQVGFARKSHIDDRTAVGIWLSRADEGDDQEG